MLSITSSGRNKNSMVTIFVKPVETLFTIKTSQSWHHCSSLFCYFMALGGCNGSEGFYRQPYFPTNISILYWLQWLNLLFERQGRQNVVMTKWQFRTLVNDSVPPRYFEITELLKWRAKCKKMWINNLLSASSLLFSKYFPKHLPRHK